MAKYCPRVSVVQPVPRSMMNAGVVDHEVKRQTSNTSTVNGHVNETKNLQTKTETRNSRPLRTTVPHVNIYFIKLTHKSRTIQQFSIV